MVKISVLAENTAFNPNFSSEHGLSLYIETGKHKILFDSGQSDLFAENAVLLGIDLSKVDIFVLSHGHYDHGGGLLRFLKINKAAPIYMSKYAFGSYYDAAGKYIGLSESLKASGRIVFVDNELLIDDGLTLCTCNDKGTVYPIDSAGLNVKNENRFLKDNFFHEQYLVINNDGKKIAVSGCSHKGVLNIMNWLRPDIFIGGFHFMNQDVLSENAVLNNAAHELLKYDTDYYTCHCTGFVQYSYLKRKMSEKLRYISSGDSFEI